LFAHLKTLRFTGDDGLEANFVTSILAVLLLRVFAMIYFSISIPRALLAALAVLPLSAWSDPAQIPAVDLSGLPGITHEQNDRVPEGAIWTEMYFPSSDGVVLHADVLRPVDLPGQSKTPVILSISSYLAHAGQIRYEDFQHTGPSMRFRAFVDGGNLMQRGYTYVMVDLRGFGGSTGCLDWLGPGEQADIVAALAWIRGQPWSNGKVGMYGKSYDASTGLVGVTLGRQGADAVVAQAPVWNMYNYLFNYQVPRWNHLKTPEHFNGIVQIPPMADDTPRYAAAAVYEQTHPECLQNNLTGTQNRDPKSSYWRARDLPSKARGSRVPLLLTQGTLEPNTKPEDIERFLTNHIGPEYGWVGPWEHVSGNDVGADGQLRMGREGWFDTVMAFFDTYLKGDRPFRKDAVLPAFAIQDNLGVWRAQSRWPHQGKRQAVPLLTGSYVDTGQAGIFKPGMAIAQKVDMPIEQYDMETLSPPPRKSAVSSLSDLADSSSLTTYSTPVNRPLRLTGTPRVVLGLRGTGHVVVDLWDVATDGSAVLINDMMSVIERRRLALDLRSMDWTLAVGHRLAVRVGTNFDDGYWLPSASSELVVVHSATLQLFLQNPERDISTQGRVSPWLTTYMSDHAAAGTVTPGPGRFSLDFPRRH
jgi:putative CocE/NonD family hydrolase